MQNKDVKAYHEKREISKLILADNDSVHVQIFFFHGNESAVISGVD